MGASEDSLPFLTALRNRCLDGSNGSGLSVDNGGRGDGSELPDDEGGAGDEVVRLVAPVRLVLAMAELLPVAISAAVMDDGKETRFLLLAFLRGGGEVILPLPKFVTVEERKQRRRSCDGREIKEVSGRRLASDESCGG
ncbi:hypothetical protein OIU79_002693 [Salix purpurea]|uniref:Uncharacterized protein n=1 Tax=Salix purpurea TaxID=77065 RepID=A0A9Q0UJT4_SALPP|nr:hypothetical protein OIU79_002693 [Salix purpurea]